MSRGAEKYLIHKPGSTIYIYIKNSQRKRKTQKVLQAEDEYAVARNYVMLIGYPTGTRLIIDNILFFESLKHCHHTLLFLVVSFHVA